MNKVIERVDDLEYRLEEIIWSLVFNDQKMEIFICD